jgi:hypothetical protein
MQLADTSQDGLACDVLQRRGIVDKPLSKKTHALSRRDCHSISERHRRGPASKGR